MPTAKYRARRKSKKAQAWKVPPYSIYNKNAQTYFESTVSLDMGKLYEPFLKHLRPGAKILDAGCDSGRDSLFFKNQGFQVTAFDASEEMVKLASQLLCQEVLHMSFENLDLPGTYDGIWACASLLHVKRAELTDVIARLTQHLNGGAAFYMSFKHGDKEYWEDGRYFNCLDENALQKTVEEVPELRLAQLFVSIDVRPDRTEERWLNAYLVRADSCNGLEPETYTNQSRSGQRSSPVIHALVPHWTIEHDKRS